MKVLANHVLRDHVLIGGVAALFVIPRLGLAGAFAFWIATVLVDSDHYLDYLIRSGFKKPGVGAMFRFHEEIFARCHQEGFLSLEIFHTLEFLVLFAWFAFHFGGLLPAIFWGMIFHMLVDLVHGARFGILTKRSHSFVEYFLRRKWLIAQGKDPGTAFREALVAAGCV